MALTADELVVVGEDREALSTIAGGISGDVTSIVADLRVRRETVAAARRLSGLIRSRRDVFVYNSGCSRPVPLVDTSDADFDAQLAVNFGAAFLLSREIGRAMTGVGGGRIVFVSSSGAAAAHPATAVYDAAKAALESLARSLAVELGRSGVCANVVRPGHILSGDNLADVSPAITLMRRAIPRGPGAAQDVAGAVRWLASDEAAYVTGTTLVVDGGRSAQGANATMQESLRPPGPDADMVDE